MVLAAGMGSRLMPLTLRRPKALFPVLNRPMLLVWLERLRDAGVRLAVVNAFHLAPMVERFLEEAAPAFPGMEIAVSRETELLGTGGGLKKVAGRLGGPAYVVNADVYGDIPLEALASEHGRRPGALAVMAVLDRPASATVSVGEDGRILSFREGGRVPGEAARLCGAGAMILSPEALRLLPEGPSDVVEGLKGMIASGGSAWALRLPQGAFWCDMGTPGDYYYRNHRLAAGGRFAEGARIDGETEGFLAAEPGAWIREGAIVRDSVLWAGAVVESGCVLSGMIVAGRARSGARLSGGVVTGD
jgi:mannose-1-phosphate guanylyltransferase